MGAGIDRPGLPRRAFLVGSLVVAGGGLAIGVRLPAKQPQIVVIAPHRIGASGIHHAAKTRIAVDFFDYRCRYDLDLAPIGIEFLGDNQRQ